MRETETVGSVDTQSGHTQKFKVVQLFQDFELGSAKNCQYSIH